MMWMMRSSRLSAALGTVAVVLLGVSPLAHGGGVLKIDETALNGEIISFDGRDITIQTGVIDGRPVRQTIPLTDAIRVRFAGGSATIDTPRVSPPPTTVTPAVIAPAPVARGAVGRGGGAPGAPAGVPVARAARGTVVVPPLAPPEAPRPIVLPVAWQLKSTGGDLLEGRIQTWAQDKIAFEFQQNAPPISVATSRVAELWRAAPELIRKARELKADSDSQDVAYVVRDRDIIAVKGVAMGIEGESLSFRYEDQDRKISVARLLGVVLVPQKNASSNELGLSAFHQALTLSNGMLLGHWRRLDNDLLTMQTLLGPELSIPVSSVIAVENRNGRVVYLSSRTPVKVEQTPYFDRLMPYRNDTSLTGGNLRLSDGEYQHGIAVHSRSVLEYDLDGRFERFQTKVGFEPGIGAIGRAAVRVMADGKPVYENADARGDEKPVMIDVEVRGVKRLTLEVDFGQNEDVGDRVIWAGARLLRAEVGR